MKRTFVSEQPLPQADAGESTGARTRLLQAALQLFSSKGVDGTSVRDLALRAGTNIAAVNYHFGSKEGLHHESLRYGFRKLTEVQPRLDALLEETRRTGTQAAAEAALDEFVHLFLKSIVAPEEQCLMIMEREKFTDNPAVQMIIREFYEPVGRVLSGIVRLIVPDASQEQVMLSTFSIIAQCVHLRQARPTLQHFLRRNPLDPAVVETMARHIANFSRAALAGMRAEAARQSRSKPGRGRHV